MAPFDEAMHLLWDILSYCDDKDGSLDRLHIAHAQNELIYQVPT